MNILSIQSHVTFGHVGNDAAVFPMQRLGCEVWPIHTLQFSNHPGYGTWKGALFAPELIGACIDGLAERGVLPSCDGILSGYLGSVAVGERIMAALALVKAANPGARYCCDPVLGDTQTGIYVRSDIPDFVRDQLVPAADILTPNQFELAVLSGVGTRSMADLRQALATIHARGPEVILVTSVLTQETPTEAIDLIVSENRTGTPLLARVRTPRLSLQVNGAGDMIAALFFVHFLRLRSASAAMACAASSLYGVLAQTASAGSRELLMVAAQDEFVAPSATFEAEFL